MISLQILVSLSIVVLLTGLASSQTNITGERELKVAVVNGTNSTVSPVIQEVKESTATSPPSTEPSTSSVTETTVTSATTSTSTTASITSTSPNVSTTSTVSTSTSEPSTTKVQPTTTKSPPSHGGRRFDAPSFFGGIILAFGLLAICYVAFKFYRSRTEHNYHSLQETVHM